MIGPCSYAEKRCRQKNGDQALKRCSRQIARRKRNRRGESVMIREMTIADYEEVLQLWMNTKGMGLRSLDDSREGIAQFLNRNPRTNFVAMEEGRITGVILCGNDGRRGYIYHTVVQQEFQNRGIGTQLINAAVHALQGEGITRVCLNVMETNEQGKAFWQNRGWEKKDFLGFYSKGITDRENRPLFE